MQSIKKNWADDGGDYDDRDRPRYPAEEMGFDPKESVTDWDIQAVGRRPRDFLARDCLFGSLFRDHRVPWFHRYMRRPKPWMENLVNHLPANSRRQALQYVVLHYLHKLHLTRLMEAADKEFGADSDEMKKLSRL